MRLASLVAALSISAISVASPQDPIATLSGWWDSAKKVVVSEAAKWQKELPPPVKAMWAKVQQLKPEDAKRLVREAPGQYRTLSKQTQNVVRQVRALNEETTWQERLNLMIELWKVRGGLHVAALLEPEHLSVATGLDGKQLTKLKGEVERAIGSLMKSS